MAADLRELAGNALECLEIRDGAGNGQELFVVYDRLSEFKPRLANALVEEARRFGVANATALCMDDFLDATADDNCAVNGMKKKIAYDTSNPLQRNAINMVAPVGRHDAVRRRITREVLLEQKAYVLQFPFVHEQTAEAILLTDPRESEDIALRMKAELDEATHYHLESGQGCVFAWPKNRNLKWVVSVGKVKKYSPLGQDGRPNGGWGNPGAEIFTSFATNGRDHGRIYGVFFADAFAAGRVLQPGETIYATVIGGGIDVERFRDDNSELDEKLMTQLMTSLTRDRYARYPGELGIGIMPKVTLAEAIETLPLEKIGGKLHIAPGYDESDRGTGGGFAMSKSHDDWGIREPLFSARVDGKWIPVLEGGTSPYFIDSAV